MKHFKNKEVKGQMCMFDNETKTSKKGDEDIKIDNVVQLFPEYTNKKGFKFNEDMIGMNSRDNKFVFYISDHLTNRINEINKHEDLCFDEVLEMFLESYVTKIEKEMDEPLSPEQKIVRKMMEEDKKNQLRI